MIDTQPTLRPVGRFVSNGFELRDVDHRLVGWRTVTGKFQPLGALTADDLRAILAWLEAGRE
jgi:hypothetical protein